MTSTNGGTVTRAELAAHIKGIDEHFDTVEVGVAEARSEIRVVRDEMHLGFQKIADSQWLGPQGRTFISGAGLVSAVAAILIAILH